ncbi:SAM-dependent methyltransferase [Sorangium sp. So ce1097]|uniref:SAM-dependent methyltransferase n=1 Tax=Sorangium sp. So ce1097 TaxID=3133330 RepID=UPI003F621259
MSTSGSLVVVGIGIQWAGQTTLAAQRAIQRADRVLFAVADPWAARWVRSLNPAAESLPYGQGETPRRSIYAEMVARILAEVRKGLKVCAVFYGHPGVLASAAHAAVRQARDEGFSARMLPGVSSIDCLFADLGLDPGRDGLQLFEATDFLIRGREVDARTPLVLCQIGGVGNAGVFDPSDAARIRRGLEALVERLCQTYPAAHEAVIYEAAAHPLASPRLDRVALAALAAARVDDISTLYVPPITRARVDPEALERIGWDGGPGAEVDSPLVH